MFRLAVDGYLWDKLDLDMKTYEVVKDALLWPVGLKKVYWDIEEDEVAEEVVDPRTFVIAPGYEDLWGCAWCGERRRMPMTWVKTAYPGEFSKVKPDNADDTVDYAKMNTVDLENEMVTVWEIWIKDDSIEEYVAADEKSAGGIVIEEKQTATRKMYPNGRIVIMTADTVLDDKPSPFLHGKPPYVAYYDTKMPHDFWGQGEPDQIEQLNREFNRSLRTLIQHAHETTDPNYVMDSSSGIDIDKFRETFKEGGQVYEKNMGAQRPVEVIPTGDLSRVHYDILNMFPNLIQVESGITDVSQGIAGKKARQSASEVSILIESSYTRTRQRIRHLEWSLKRELYLILSLAQQFYTEPRSFSFTDQGNNVWATVGNSPTMAGEATKPMRMKGESDQAYQQRMQDDQDYQQMVLYLRSGKVDKVYAAFDISIDTNSTLPMDRQTRANLMLQLAQTQVTPQSVVDREAVLDALQVGNKDEIIRRMEQSEQKKAMQAQAAMSATRPQGVNGVPQPTNG